MDINALHSKLAQFAEDRDWGKYHSPKNLAISVSVEAGELLEIFEWLTEDESWAATRSEPQREHVVEEVADVFMNLLRLAALFDIDLQLAVERKLQADSEKYPANHRPEEGDA